MIRGAPRRGRPPAPDGAPPEGRVEAVERALSLLEAFADGTPRLTLADLAARSGLYPSTALRLAGSLVRFGYLLRGPDGLFRIGPSPLRLAALYRAGFDLATPIRPALLRLVARTGETAGFFVREGDRRICLLRAHSPRSIRVHLEEGAVLTLDRGATAHVLMAYTGGCSPLHAEVRARGLALSMGERDPEIAAVAAPVFGEACRLLGALAISGPLQRLGEAELLAIAPFVVEEAAALSRALGGSPGPAPGNT
jgi:DNA-binding IclR family transcriptional regulator